MNTTIDNELKPPHDTESGVKSNKVYSEYQERIRTAAKGFDEMTRKEMAEKHMPLSKNLLSIEALDQSELIDDYRLKRVALSAPEDVRESLDIWTEAWNLRLEEDAAQRREALGEEAASLESGLVKLTEACKNLVRSKLEMKVNEVRLAGFDDKNHAQSLERSVEFTARSREAADGKLTELARLRTKLSGFGNLKYDVNVSSGSFSMPEQPQPKPEGEQVLSNLETVTIPKLERALAAVRAQKPKGLIRKHSGKTSDDIAAEVLSAEQQLAAAKSELEQQKRSLPEQAAEMNTNRGALFRLANEVLYFNELPKSVTVAEILDAVQHAYEKDKQSETKPDDLAVVRQYHKLKALRDSSKEKYQQALGAAANTIKYEVHPQVLRVA